MIAKYFDSLIIRIFSHAPTNSFAPTPSQVRNDRSRKGNLRLEEAKDVREQENKKGKKEECCATAATPRSHKIGYPLSIIR